jgi:hypothetical protein
MGKPLMDDASMGFAVQGWKAFGHTVIVRYHRIFKGEKHDGKTLEHDMWFLTQIRITSLQFSTASGIKIGSSLKDIRKQYPGLAAAETRAASPSLVLYDDAKAGIAFEIEVGMKIDGSTWPCGAITVHPPGEAVRSMPQLRD